jgi:sugar lactone lactonase YvrE
MSVERGILAVNTSDFSLRGRYPTDAAIDSLAVSPDGARVYVVSSDVAKVLRVDLASGGAVTTVSGPVEPLAVLRVDSKASR